MKEKNIVQYTRYNLPKGKTDWVRVKNLTDEEIEEAAQNDPDNPIWTDDMFEAAVLKSYVLGHLHKKIVPADVNHNLEAAKDAVKRLQVLAKEMQLGPFYWDEWKSYRDIGRSSQAIEKKFIS